MSHLLLGSSQNLQSRVGNSKTDVLRPPAILSPFPFCVSSLHIGNQREKVMLHWDLCSHVIICSQFVQSRAPGRTLMINVTSKAVKCLFTTWAEISVSRGKKTPPWSNQFSSFYIVNRMICSSRKAVLISVLCMHAKSLQSCLTFCNPMDHNLPGFSVHGILQARILKWVAISFSRGSSQPRDWTRVSCIGRCVLYQ